MDTELARTFLEIVSAGSFIRAAERLNVAQTTVSSRIRILEERIGRPLFVRNKTGASLTPAGEQFLRYAPTFLLLWERARHQVAVPAGHSTVLAVGGELSLWQPLLLDWVVWMRRSMPDVALRVQVDLRRDLISQVSEGLVDIALVYAPQHRPGLKIDLIMEEKLVLVSSSPNPGPVGGADYVYVDWGPDFALHHARTFPDASNPGLSVALGPLALGYILANGGSGYFRMRVVQKYLESGRLHLVPGMPQFSYPIYAVHSTGLDEALVSAALAGLHAVSESEA